MVSPSKTRMTVNNSPETEAGMGDAWIALVCAEPDASKSAGFGVDVGGEGVWIGAGEMESPTKIRSAKAAKNQNGRLSLIMVMMVVLFLVFIRWQHPFAGSHHRQAGADGYG